MLGPWPVHIAMWPKASDTLTPTWSQWYSRLVEEVNLPIGLIDLTTGVTGILPVGNGGTGFNTIPVNRIPYGNGAAPLQSDPDLTFNGSTLTLNGLYDISGAAGGQIQFPATQNPSAGANTFDDYEESPVDTGWTPIDSSGAGLVFAGVTADYLKWGQGVMAAAALTFPVTVSGANVLIGGLPFTSQAATATKWPVIMGFTNSGLTFHGRVNQNATTMQFTTTAGVPITNVQLSGTVLRLTALYRAAA